jgi:MscS family membrane protein
MMAVIIHSMEDEILGFFKGQVWMLYTALVLALAMGLTYLVHLVYHKLSTKLSQGDHFIIVALMRAIYWPLNIFIWIEAIAVTGNVFIPHGDASLLLLLEKLQKISLVILLAWIFIRFIKLFEEQLLQGRLQDGQADENTIQATGKLLRVAAIIIVALLLLPIMGVQITGLVAFASGSAIIVGIAAQHIIANYFGGLVVHSDGHFKIGDWIYSPDRDIEGIVEYIHWRSTQIRTFDRQVRYVPNSVFSSIIVVNATRMTNRRIKETIRIRMQDAALLEPILADINQMLRTQPDLDKRRIFGAHFTEFGPYSLNINVYAFTKAIDWYNYRTIQQNIFLNVIKIIQEHGAQLANVCWEAESLKKIA